VIIVVVGYKETIDPVDALRRKKLSQYL